MNETSKSKHILDLVKDLLEDIELDRSSGDKVTNCVGDLDLNQFNVS